MENILSIIGCIFMIILSKKKTHAAPEGCITYYEKGSSDVSHCYCYNRTWVQTPSITENCKVFGFHNAQLIRFNKSWIRDNSIFENTQKFGLYKTKLIEFNDDKLLEGFKNLEMVEFIQTELPLLENFYWPKSLRSINVSHTPLSTFIITNYLLNLEFLQLQNCTLKTFPKIDKKLPLTHINLKGNENISIVYEDVVSFCRLKVLLSNDLVGARNGTQSEDTYCKCFRLKNWLYQHNILNDIDDCKFSSAKPNFEPQCNGNYSFLNYTRYDPCGRRIIGNQKFTLEWIWLLVAIAFASFAVATINSFVNSEKRKISEQNEALKQNRNPIQEDYQQSPIKNTQQEAQINEEHQSSPEPDEVTTPEQSPPEQVYIQLETQETRRESDPEPEIII